MLSFTTIIFVCQAFNLKMMAWFSQSKTKSAIECPHASILASSPVWGKGNNMLQQKDKESTVPKDCSTAFFSLFYSWLVCLLGWLQKSLKSEKWCRILSPPTQGLRLLAQSPLRFASLMFPVFPFLTPFVLNVYCKLTWLSPYTKSPLYF